MTVVAMMINAMIGNVWMIDARSLTRQMLYIRFDRQVQDRAVGVYVEPLSAAISLTKFLKHFSLYHKYLHKR